MVAAGTWDVDEEVGMDLKQLVLFALQISIFTTVLGLGLTATTGDLLYLWRRPGLLARSLLAMLVLMPLVAIVLVRTFDFPHAMEVALVALAISPVPPLLPNRENKAGGSAPYGLGLMATVGALSIVVVPVAVGLLQRVFDRPLGFSAASVAAVMLTMVLVPLGTGVATRSLAPSVADRIARPLATIGKVLLLLAGLPLLLVAAPAIWQMVGDGTILGSIAFVAAGLAIGQTLGGPDPDHAVVLALSTACRHPAVSLAVASANFPDERFGGAILLYLIVNIVVTIPYIAWQHRRLTHAVPAG
jgi:bile acid:Na+ symporter, BASS family